MTESFPFLTRYDPPGASEGTLDPMGLYQIADQLAVQLVPAVRERMQRIRFLTAIAVGAMVTEGLEDNPEFRDSSPYLVWEWLVAEAFVNTQGDQRESRAWGMPGRDVTQRALKDHGYLDARSYLKTPRVFGFNGVYKRLALHLGLVNVHLAPGPNAERLVDAWARTQGLSGITGAKVLFSKWTEAVRRCLREKPPRTKTGWNKEDWAQLANGFAPDECKGPERRFLREQLCRVDDGKLGAFPHIWELQAGFAKEDYGEEELHNRLEEVAPVYGPLLRATRAYESFARSLHDAFDVLRAVAKGSESELFTIASVQHDPDFVTSVSGLNQRFEKALKSLGEVTVAGVSLPNLFTSRFQPFSEPMDLTDCARAICLHHEGVQRSKSDEGKRAWFDRVGADKIHIRKDYRIQRRDIAPGKYVHFYRGYPIRRFYRDLT